MRIAANFYNRNLDSEGNPSVVITGKILNEIQRKSLVWDIERGQSNEIEPFPWQTDTCIGSWHYDRRRYLDKSYKKPEEVIHLLCDVVSKNGNLMLNIPVRGDGSIGELELAIVEEIGGWVQRNGEGIFGTRPWKIFGESPAQEGAAELTAQGFNEGKGMPFTYSDIRFTTKDNNLYATVMGWPKDRNIFIKSLKAGSKIYTDKITRIELLSTKSLLKFKRDKFGLHVELPDLSKDNMRFSYANTLKIT